MARCAVAGSKEMYPLKNFFYASEEGFVALGPGGLSFFWVFGGWVTEV